MIDDRTIDDDARRTASLFDLHILDTPPEPEFDDVVQLARKFCETSVALVSLVASDRQWFKARVGFDACETPIGQSVCVHALAGEGLLVVPDLTLDPRTRHNLLVTGEPHIRFYAGAVLKTEQGVPIGTLCVIDSVPRPAGLTVDQAEALRALGRQTMALMTLRRAAQERDSALARMRQAGLATLDRARALEARSDRLAATEARLRGAQQAARVGAFELDLATKRVFVTPEFCRLFGIPLAEDLALDGVESAIVSEDRHIIPSNAERADGTGAPDCEYRIRRADDGTVRWIARRGAPEMDERGVPIRWLGIVQDVTERKTVEAHRIALVTLGDALRDADTTAAVIETASRLLGETLDLTRAGYAMVDLAADLLTVERDWAPAAASIAGRHPIHAFARTIDNLESGIPLAVADVPAATWLASDAPAYAAIDTKALIKIPLVHKARLVGMLFAHSAIPRTWSNVEIAFADAVADRAHAAIAKVMAEDHQRLLNQELSHRLKNTLSMVQAIASQTLRGAADRPAVRAFEERIIALSGAHDVLLQQNWAAASIRALVDGVFNLNGCAGRILASGPDLQFGPKATLSTSMLLHELATNAIKYGALSNETGHVELSWSPEVGESASFLSMVWTERGGPAAQAPQRRGFGSRLISMGIAGAGNAVLDYEEAGLVARFRAPMSVVTEH